MAKLKKREIIILVMAGLFLLYAGYEYLIAGPTRKKVITNTTSVNVNTVINGLTSDLMKDKLSAFDEHLIGRLGDDWVKNPFWKKDAYKAWVTRDAVATGIGATAKIIYSGYIEAGKNKMAVINGLEYRVGEQLEVAGYVLKRITPLKVLIVNKNTGSEVEITLQE